MNSTQRPDSIHHCIVGSSETGRGQSIPAVKISTEFFITGKLDSKSYWAKNHFQPNFIFKVNYNLSAFTQFNHRFFAPKYDLLVWENYFFYVWVLFQQISLWNLKKYFHTVLSILQAVQLRWNLGRFFSFIYIVLYLQDRIESLFLDIFFIQVFPKCFSRFGKCCHSIVTSILTLCTNVQFPITLRCWL